MTAINRTDIVGRRLRRVLQTPWSDPVVHGEGLGEAVYCIIVFELDDGKQFSTYDGEFISPPPTDGEPLSDAEVFGHEESAFLDLEIKEVIAAEFGETDLFFLLENGVCVTDHDTEGNGNRLFVIPENTIKEFHRGPFTTFWDGAEWQPPPQTECTNTNIVEVTFTFRGPKPATINMFQKECAAVEHLRMENGRVEHQGVVFLHERDGFWKGTIIDEEPGVHRFRPLLPGYVGSQDVELRQADLDRGELRVDFTETHLHRSYIPIWLRQAYAWLRELFRLSK